MKKIVLTLLAVSVFAGLAFAGGGKDSGKAGQGSNEPIPTIDQLTLGKDFTDLKASIQFKTHRTDLMDTVLPKYVADFKKL